MTNGWMDGWRRGTTRDSLNLGNEGKGKWRKGGVVIIIFINFRKGLPSFTAN